MSNKKHRYIKLSNCHKKSTTQNHWMPHSIDSEYTLHLFYFKSQDRIEWELNMKYWSNNYCHYLRYLTRYEDEKMVIMNLLLMADNRSISISSSEE